MIFSVRCVPAHRRMRFVLSFLTAMVFQTSMAESSRSPDYQAKSGEELYRLACASCHGANGRGAPASLLGFDVPPPDFTDCSFASREPHADWVIVAHEGGPIRGFSEYMPAFGDALGQDELERIVTHVKDFCRDHAWPPGEFNLPKALVTEKAYLEDETYLSTTISTEDQDKITGKFVYEKRFGARNQVEVVIPFGWWEQETNDPADPYDGTNGIGDVAFAVKRALYDNLRKGTIISVTGEVILPTGDENGGLGKGTAVFEPFVTWGQIMPADFFLQAQVGVELPANNDKADDEALMRMTIGRRFTSGEFGRTWSPMIEFLGARDLESGADTHWDAVPQIQITLNTRQHIMLNLGVRTPLNDTATRDTQFLLYVLWDWFDGGLTEGW